MTEYQVLSDVSLESDREKKFSYEEVLHLRISQLEAQVALGCPKCAEHREKKREYMRPYMRDYNAKKASKG